MAALTLGDLHVSFFSSADRLGRNQLASVDQPAAGETAVGSEENQPVVVDVDPELREDLRLAQLMTDNPVAYEQEMIDANLSGQEVHVEPEDAGS